MEVKYVRNPGFYYDLYRTMIMKMNHRAKWLDKIVNTGQESEDIQYVDTVYRFNNTPYEFPKIQNAKNEHWFKQIENLDNKIKALEDEYSSLEQEYEDLDEELKQISFCIDEYFGYYQCKDTNDCPRNKFQEFQD